MKKNLPENVWNSPEIRQRLYSEACFECEHGVPSEGREMYWVSAPEGDTLAGEVVLVNYQPDGFLVVDPHPIQKQFAEDLRKKLQKEISMGGIWIVGWTHPPEIGNLLRVDGDNCWGRLFCIWLDEDCDPHMTYETDSPVVDIVGNGVDFYVGRAEEAWTQWNADYSMRRLSSEMALKEHDMTKKTLAALN